MDPQYDPFFADAFEQSIEQPAFEDDPALDPLAEVERSIEQPIEPTAMYFDDPLLSQLEDSIENLTLRPDAWCGITDADDQTDEPEGPLHGQPIPEPSGPVCVGPLTDGPPVPPAYSPPRPWREPASTYRMRGSRSGLRSSGDSSLEWFCCLYDQCVTDEECQSCKDYEELDNDVPEDERHCRHAIYA